MVQSSDYVSLGRTQKTMRKLGQHRALDLQTHNLKTCLLAPDAMEKAFRVGRHEKGLRHGSRVQDVGLGRKVTLPSDGLK